MTAKRPEEAFDETPETPADSQQEESRSEATADAEPEAADDVADEGADTGLAELQAKAAENWDRYLRAVAELDNVRKRATRDVSNAHKYALEGFGKELLAVRDSLEMGIAAENASVETLLEGSEATLKLLTTTLERFGILEVDPVGEPLDPEFHEAISMRPSDSVEPGSVATVVQKGYTLNGRLLRPAMVIVAAE